MWALTVGGSDLSEDAEEQSTKNKEQSSNATDYRELNYFWTN